MARGFTSLWKKPNELSEKVAYVINLLEADYNPRSGKELPESTLQLLCREARKLFLSQPMLLELGAPLKICGDIHGQYSDLLRIFRTCGFPSNSNYLFLGDYVDRGQNSIETLALLLAYKLKYPYTFFMLRGNHESADVNRVYGFYDECKRRYSVKLWHVFVECYSCMPVAAIVEGKIFCCHGGLSPELQNMEDIRKLGRPTDVPMSGLMCDLLWSDPDKNTLGWGHNDRGVSYTFGDHIVTAFLAKHNFDLIVRGHQVVEDGYELFANRKLMTIFSAPNYCNMFDNSGAVLDIDRLLVCKLTIIKPNIVLSSSPTMAKVKPQHEKRDTTN